MRKTFTASMALVMFAIVLFVTRSGVTAQTTNKDEVALRAAMDKETLQGDLKAAIELYKKVVQSKDRSVAARAIIRMAECYQKLGDTEARTLYERVIHEYPEQKEPVALAHARLDVTSSATSAKGDRPVWSGPLSPTTNVSPDGRFIAFVGFQSLWIHDIAANTDRQLTPRSPSPPFATPGASAISRDGKQIAYRWNENGRAELRIAALEVSGFLKPRASVFVEDGLMPYDWSPDGKWILATIGHPTTELVDLGIISVADGEFRKLETHDVDGISHRLARQFSPDGKYIAYDRPGVKGSSQRDVYVISIDGQRNIPAVVHSANDNLMSWSPDGSRILFSSDRTGSVGLWSVPFADGKVQGPPELLKYIGPSFALGPMTDSGAIYVHKTFNTRGPAVVGIDLDAGKLQGAPVPFTLLETAPNPSWSADGKYLAYLACNIYCLAIRSVDTGETRRLPATLGYYGAPTWSPDGRSLFVSGQLPDRGHYGIFQIDAQSGDAKPVILDDGLSALAQVSPDGKKVYFNRRGVFIERDLASGAERDVYNGPGLRFGALSPDGRYFAIAVADAPTKTASLLVVPVVGGEPREALHLSPSEILYSPATWTPDSSALIIQKNTGSRWELWRIPLAGGPPRKLDIDASLWREGGQGGQGAIVQQGDTGFSLSPDGHNVAVTVGKNTSEVWVLENLLPKVSARK